MERSTLVSSQCYATEKTTRSRLSPPHFSGKCQESIVVLLTERE
ncbi:MAG: hypothetical protein SVX43_18330 [Cyanobacteriota bacterium]|nr:hypothetical protein [Cyanobacteriota bacterium]